MTSSHQTRYARRKVAVIGAAGRMGAWFVEYFSSRAQSVYAYDVRPIRKNVNLNSRVLKCTSLEDSVTDADTIMICVPVSSAPETIKKCAELARRGTILAEISSIKKKSFAALAKVQTGTIPLCIHPMFGPGAGYQDLRWILIPVRNRDVESNVANILFSGSTFIVLKDWSEHDTAMGIILGLTYFVNLAFADVISQWDLSYLMRIAGTTFTLQSLLSESIVAEEPSLIGAVVSSNPQAWSNISRFLKSCKELQRSMKDDKLIRQKSASIATRLTRSQNLEQSYRTMYHLFSALRGTTK